MLDVNTKKDSRQSERIAHILFFCLIRLRRMHLFPRHVKEKRLGASPTSSTPTGDGGGQLQRSISPSSESAAFPPTATGQSSSMFTPNPSRKVYLTTVNRKNPLQRHTRELGGLMRPKDDQTDTKKRDEDRDMVTACAPYTESFNHLLRSVPKRSKHVVQLVLDRMRQEQVPLDATTYNLLLEKVVDLKDDFAFKIFEEFREESQKDDASVRPDLRTFHLLMRACERNGMYDRAFQLYAQMKELLGIYPDVGMYNTLIGFCAPLHDERMASSIAEEMKDRGVDPDVHTYNCLMNVFGNAPYEVTLQTFEDMVRRRIKPNLRSFNTLMRACMRMWDYDRAFQYFEELKKEGLVPDVVTYNILLIMCRERLHFVFGTGQHSHLRRTKEQRDIGMKAVAELAMSLFAEMEDLEILPNTFTYNALIAVLGQCDDFRVMDVFTHMKADNRQDTAAAAAGSDGMSDNEWIAENTSTAMRGGGSQALTVSTSTAAAVAPSAAAPSKSGGAVVSLASTSPAARGLAYTVIVDQPDAGISARGVFVNLETYKWMIEAALRMKLTKMAFIFFKELKDRDLRPDKDIFLLMMRVCCLEGQKTEAAVLFQEAKAAGLLDVDVYNGRLDVLANAKDGDELFTAFDRLRQDSDRMSLKPNEGSYNVVLRGCYKLEVPAKALAIYDSMIAPGSTAPPPNTETYGILIDIASLSKDTKLATNYILEMKRRRVPITIATYCRLMHCFVAADDAGVVSIYDELRQHGPPPNLEAAVILLRFYESKRNAAIVTLFDELKTSGPVEPDLECYNIMLEYCAAIGSHQKSFKYFEELKTRGMAADINTYNALIAVFAPTGSDFVFKVFEEMQELKIPPNHVTFSILMKHKLGRQCLATATEQKLIYVEPPSQQGQQGQLQ